MSLLVALLTFREPISAWSHCLWLLLSVPATLLLWRRCPGDRGRQLSLLVFGVSLAICYAGSTLFHAVRLPRIWINRFDEFDHIGIFILIAGSYTPVAWNQFQGPLRWGILGAAWFVAGLGTSLLLICGVFPMFWSTCFYLAMGWAAVICYIEMARELSHRTLFPMLLGGILYSVGALINLTNWPVFWPGVFGSHELFHLFVMAASLAHFDFMLKVVATPASLPLNAGWAGAEPEAAFPPTKAPGHAAPGRDRQTDPFLAKGHCQPLYLHVSPQWRREDGA